MHFEIEGKKYYLENDGNINCIMLYGSYARHENDLYSDIDILIITEKAMMKQYIILDTSGKRIPEKWISIYSKEIIEKMKKYPSLFLWQFKL